MNIMKLEQKEFHKVVDLDKIIANSNNNFLKRFPRFIVNYMKRILCQEELNIIHNKYKEEYGIQYINSLLSEFNVDIIVHNQDLISDVNRAIFVANHPLGGIDAMSFLSVIHKLKGKVVSPSNELFNYVPNLRPLIVGVNVFGVNTKEKIAAVNEAFNGDDQIMIFPAGIVSRKFKGKVRDTAWHKSFVTKAIQTDRVVVPAYISGKNSRKFYLIGKIRKFFGIKLSVETLFLPQEMFKNKGRQVDIVFGKPISPGFFDKSKSHHQWAQYVRELVYSLVN